MVGLRDLDDLGDVLDNVEEVHGDGERGQVRVEVVREAGKLVPAREPRGRTVTDGRTREMKVVLCNMSHWSE